MAKDFKKDNTSEIDTKKILTELNHLIENAEILIEQLNNLYNMYAAGVEVMPPVAKRRQLEALMKQMLTMPKTSSALQFRWGSIQARFNVHKDRWDRIIKDLELGKIKRPVRK